VWMVISVILCRLATDGSCTVCQAFLCSAQVKAHGPGLAGALFGAGWCFWLDAVLVNAMHGTKLPFLAVRSAVAFRERHRRWRSPFVFSTCVPANAVPPRHHRNFRDDIDVRRSKVCSTAKIRDEKGEHEVSAQYHRLPQAAMLCRADLSSFDSYDSAYVVSFGSIIGACVLLISHMSEEDGTSYTRWVGWVRSAQRVCVIISVLNTLSDTHCTAWQ
jgi:hypothetical protein